MYETKTCPRCGQTLFADMDVCFECLFDFTEDERSVPVEVYEEAASDAVRGLRIVSEELEVMVPLPARGLVVGRGSASDVVLHDPSVSRAHVRIEPAPDGEQVLVRDLGAQNKATIGTRRVEGECTLDPGETLLVCGTRFLLA